MRLLTVIFSEPVMDPRDPGSIHKKLFSAPLHIEAHGETVTLTCSKSGARVVTNVRYSGVPAPEKIVGMVEVEPNVFAEAAPVQVQVQDASEITKVQGKGKRRP